MESKHKAHIRIIKIHPILFRSLLNEYFDIRNKQGDWQKQTATHYRLALRQFYAFYDANFEEFDSTHSLLREWLIRCKANQDNTNNYRAVGRFARSVADTVCALSSLNYIDVSRLTELKYVPDNG